MSVLSSIARVDWLESTRANRLDTAYQSIRDAVKEDGVVIVNHALDDDQIDAIVSEMTPYIDTTPHGLHGLERSRRVGALVARSPASHKAIAHPAVLDLCEAVLGEQQNYGKTVKIIGRDTDDGRYPWRVGLTQVIDVGPGQEKQPVHRGNGLWVHNLAGCGFDPQIETMWALTDFTEENGATHVIPGSHRWTDVMESKDDNTKTIAWFHELKEATLQAEMPKGSVLIWTGWTIHGAGANTTENRRIGMNIDYSLSFLAQEENQFLACPPHIAKDLSDEMRRLIGYTQGGPALNYFADCLRPKAVLKDDYDVLAPGSHGMPVV